MNPDCKYDSEPINAAKSKSKILRKTRRSLRKPKPKKLVIIGTNSDGLNQKSDSLHKTIEELMPSVFMIQETKFSRKGKFRANHYEIFEQIRTQKGGGGLLTGVHEDLSPVLVSDGSSDDIEILVVEADVSEHRVRFINGYGPQENANVDDRIKFFARLEEEIVLSKLNGCLTCVELDANAKLGPQVIPGDPHGRTDNGELLLGIIERNNLTVCNSSQLCTGVITRRKTTINGIEESVIDFFLICEQLNCFLEKVLIDESRKYSLARYQKLKSGVKVIESDHHSFVATFNICIQQSKSQGVKHEMFNFKDEEGQRKYKEMTSGTALSNIFLNSNVTDPGKKWHKEVQNILHRSFKKIRVKGPKPPDKETMKIMKEKTKIIQKIDDFKGKQADDQAVSKTEYVEYFLLSDSLEAANEAIGNKTAEKNAEMILEHFGSLVNCEGGFSLPKMWGLKKKICPKIASDVPTAMLDNQRNLITNKTSLVKLYKNTYEERLSPKAIKSGWEELKELKDLLYKLRLEKSSLMQTVNWTEEQVIKMCKSLKNNKARDSSGFVYELFKPEMAGSDMFKSLSMMFNLIKSEMKTSLFMKKMTITSLYKNKGVRNDFSNQRGIFNLSKVKSMLDKLIYEDTYDQIDSNLSYSNIGGRKGRNIRDHLMIVYGVINDVINGQAAPIDIQLFDISKCFDEMWHAETMNDIWDTSIQDDKFAMIARLDQECFVKVKTPCGETEEFELSDLVLQGSVFGPIKCCVQIDTLGRDCLAQDKCLYNYKNMVSVPPLALIDDIVSITKCDADAIEANAVVNMKIESKKLRLSKDKCAQLHVGKNNLDKCDTNLKVHEDPMKRVHDGAYLGDIISDDGTIDKLIESRRQKGIGICSQVVGILSSVSLGFFFYKIAFTLRDAKLLNGMLTNAEVWNSIKSKHIDVLEKIDLMLMKKIINAHSMTAKEAFFLEAGLVPIKFMLSKRRLMYLWNILHRNENELLKRFYIAQKLSRTKNDWTELVEKDKSDLGIDLTDDEISRMKESEFKNIVNIAATKMTLLNLNKTADSHSKSRILIKSKLERENYFDDQRFSRSDVELLFKLRTRMVDLKSNFSNKYGTDIACRLCQVQVECQEHILKCEALKVKVEIAPHIVYEDIFKNVDKQLEAVQVFKKLLREREIILNSS